MDQDPRRRRERTSRRGNGHNGGRRKPSPSPTRCPGTELKRPSASPPPPPRTPGWMESPLPAPAGDGSWLILDRFVHYSRRRQGIFDGDGTTSSVAQDCAGRQMRVSLRIADPPAVSRLYLHWSGGMQNILDFSVPTAIAAHRNSILFQMTVPFDNHNWWHATPSFPIDYFVYSCSSSSSPSLTWLPPCFYGGDNDPVLDKFVQQHRRQQQRIMFNAEMGILCHGDNGERFTVAHLCHHQLELCLLHQLPKSDVPMAWSLKKLKIPQDMKIDLNSWRTDVVVPIGKSLCWVDYYQGMLFVDILAPADSKDSPNDQLLHGVRLPAQALKYRRLYNENGDPDPFRHVCVTDDGIIKLVCVLLKRLPDDDDFKIITWTLVDINTGSWRKDVDTIIVADDFFDLYDDAQSCLPRVQPTFPVMSLVDPDVICFLLIKEEDCNLTWIVEVNMRSKVLLSSALYINEEEEEEGRPSENDCMNGFYGHYFIPTKFSSYLSKDAITR
ncbi:hypothetical protein HU200_013245 [Digitaria exilis]|uniref:DUF1618 domain-containing protein n=1 Tax=Digitaria exilis TaxID=1010633 RepID=A0A835FDQ5_9POAL|nr:hypothetical protein HU200_013245 [Digitaria exilis]